MSTNHQEKHQIVEMLFNMNAVYLPAGVSYLHRLVSTARLNLIIMNLHPEMVQHKQVNEKKHQLLN